MAQARAEPSAEVEPQPGEDPLAGSQGLEGSFTKGLISKYPSSSEIFVPVIP